MKYRIAMCGIGSAVLALGMAFGPVSQVSAAPAQECVNEDTNGDGVADVVYADNDGDGYIDAIVYDRNFDGEVDMVVTKGQCIVDTNSDGTHDHVIDPPETRQHEPGQKQEPETQQHEPGQKQEPETQQHEPGQQQEPETQQHEPGQQQEPEQQ
ncbi:MULTISPECIES: hypothetical protein [Streptomyces]|uniref:hypothetical protein n=1 Tax=Streptomyces TaxID=1883 RepID=UPI000A42DDE6|nr:MULTISPECIES: hypothetical protein [Streptomyces]